MNKKKILIVASAIIVAGLCYYGVTGKKSDISDEQKDAIVQTENFNAHESLSKKTDSKEQVLNSPEETPTTVVIKASVHKDDDFITKMDLHNEIPSSAMPLSAISILAELPKNVQDSVLKLAESNNIYMIQPKKDKLLVITDNPENIRHSIEFTEISTVNGQQFKTTLGYNDKIKDSENDKWEYNDAKQPVRHSKYNNDGDLEFVETWNYNSSEPIKYEMKDGKGKVLSVRKETLENGTNLRVEHLLYDKDGKTRINVSAAYEGEDLKRFTYYNADKISESGSIFSDYYNGLKTKETVYTSDLKVKNSYTSEYKDDNRSDIIKWDNKNQEVHKYLPEEETL